MNTITKERSTTGMMFNQPLIDNMTVEEKNRLGIPLLPEEVNTLLEDIEYAIDEAKSCREQAEDKLDTVREVLMHIQTKCSHMTILEAVTHTQEHYGLRSKKKGRK